MLTLALISLVSSEASKALPHQWQFDTEAVIQIGRSPQNQIVVEHPLVSRHHAEIRRVPQADGSIVWLLIALGKNGTFLEGRLITQAAIRHGSLIQLATGGPTLQVQLRSMPGSGPIPSHQSCGHGGHGPNDLFCTQCGQPLRVEFMIRQYKVLRTLGQGGMGTTYLVWRDRLEVLKEMNADIAQIPKAQELFEREARILSNLHHPGIPQFFDFFVEGGKKYLAMELIHGRDLEKYLAQAGAVPPALAIPWMIQTCEVLDYLHHQDPPIIHRDIKPANLLVRQQDQRIVVLDFGAVKEIGTPPGTRIGAEGYSAPEQDRGRPVTQSDLYAIGPTLIFLLTRQLPQTFYGKRQEDYGFQLEGVGRISAPLRSVIERITAYKPAQRYQTAKEVITALQSCL